jgi:hypothetical protein
VTKNEPDRPAFIKVNNVKGLVMRNNLAIGDADFAQVSNSQDVQAYENVHLTGLEDPSSKSWYEKPLGIVVLTVISGVIIAGIAYFFGWT